MNDTQRKRLWHVAIGLALIGSLLALANVAQQYRSTGELDWGRVALAVGVPALFYALARSTTTRQNR